MYEQQPSQAPNIFMCLAVCATCACHLIIFISEESLFVDTIIGRPTQQYFTWRIFDIVTKQLLHLLVSWKSVRYLANLVNARPSHVEHASLRPYSFLVDFASALLRFAQVAYEYHCEVWLPYFFHEKWNILRGHSKMLKCPPFCISCFT